MRVEREIRKIKVRRTIRKVSRIKKKGKGKLQVVQVV